MLKSVDNAYGGVIEFRRVEIIFLMARYKQNQEDRSRYLNEPMGQNSTR